MKYLVRCRDSWDTALKDQFGDINSIHTLSGDDVVQAIIKHGRAEITTQDYAPTGCMVLEFQNDYD